MKAKLLVTGSNGQLGREISEQLSKDFEIIGISRQEADLNDAATITNLIGNAEPHYVWHAAAYTNVDACEQDAERAMKVNAIGTANVARACEAVGCTFIYFSTDFVFDGKKDGPYLETDEPKPINAYGRSKLEGERVVESLNIDSIIARIGWIYGAHGRNFIRSILTHGKNQMQSRKQGDELVPIRIVDDQFGSPTWTRDIVMQTKAIMEKKLSGIFHVAATGETNRYEFATQILEKMIPDVELAPCSTSEMPAGARRPRRSSLASCRLAETGIKIGPYDERLQHFLNKYGEALLNEV